MHDFEDQDTCRICSAPAEPDQPLFHPCKCSGTIRYIHQDCLTTWLAHSKKKSCDVCKHPYAFTKVYAPDMPSSIPPLLFIRRLLQHLFLTLLFVLRAIAVATIWLGVLPWVTVWTWRMYFSMGESTAWWISDRPRPSSSETPLFNKIRYDTQAPPPKNFLARINSHPLWGALSADIFTGQIIASLIVLTFVAVFLLREWISQNARPGVFEDEEPLPEDPLPGPPPQQLGLVPPPGPPAPRLVFANPQQRRPLPPVPPVNPPAPRLLEVRELHPRMDALLAMETAELARQNFIPPIASEPSRWDLEGHRDDIDRRPRKKKNKVKQSDGEDDVALRVRRKLERDAEIRRKMFHRRIYMAKTTAVRHRMTTRRAASSSPPSLRGVIDNNTAKEEHEFTFTAPLVESSSNPSSARQSRESSLDLTSSWQSLPTSPTTGPLQHSAKQDQPSPESPFPSVTLQPPSGSIPFSLRPTQPNDPPPSYPSRPVLPTIPLPRSGTSSPFLYSPGRTNLDSPSHSTYRAPEELAASFEVGPSDYFARDGDSGQRDVSDFIRQAAAEPTASTSQTQDSGDDTESLSDLEKEDIQAEHDRYFGNETDIRNAASPIQLDLLSDSDSDVTTEDDGRGLGDLDDDDGQPPDLFGGEDVAARDGENALGEGNVVVRVVAPPQRQAAPVANQPPAEAPAAANAENEEADANVEDDMEGAMEAIGMRGPIFGVFQNAALMIFVLDTAVGLCIWLPFTVGKTTALLSLDPHRMLQVMHLPIRAMRLVTDPVVDLVAYILLDLILPWTLSALSVFFRIFMFFGSNLIGKLLPITTNSRTSELSFKLLNHTSEFITKPLNFVVPWSSSSNDTASTINISASLSWLESVPDYLGPLEPYFVRIGSEVREAVTSAQTTWVRLAVGSGPTNRVFAILLGYVVTSFFFCVYLNIVTVGNAKAAGSALRNIVKQQLLVIKVAAFIFIELVIFPLGCGIVLDLCTVWLFPEANMLSRIAFFWQAPLTAMFYHWVAGTMFMYTFAVLLSGCRSVMRPGAMWFIKDPQDQNSHPIRDILDRPTLVQLRKIFISGLMYSFVVACVVGSIAGLLLMGSKSVMPFRWKNREPLSNVPVDLLFLHLVLPYTMHYFRPKRAIKEVATVVWQFLATRLRLTSYFFGGRHPQEEFTPKDWRENLLRSEIYVAKPDDVADGSFRRVPATDNLALPRDMWATVAVTVNGEPVDEDARKLMAMQNAEAEKAKHNIQDDYTIVYIPPSFRWRIITFITLLWIIGAICIGFAVAIPLSLGRSFFRLFTPRDVHDGYSFIVGFCLVWVCYLIGRAVDRLDRRRKRRSGTDGPRAELGLLVAKRGFLWLAKVAYMTLSLGIVVPILLAIVIDLYIVLPIRFSLDPGMVPRIRIVDQWSLGLLYAKIGIYVQRIQPPNRISAGLQHIMQLGWTQLDPIMATKELIAPLVGGLLGMIIIPGAAFKALLLYFPEIIQDNRFTFLHVYPLVFIIASAARSAINLYGALSAWSVAIRDKEFLVEMRLRNHESEVEDSNKAVAGERITVQNPDVVGELDPPPPPEQEN